MDIKKHFRTALKPQDLNTNQPKIKKIKTSHQQTDHLFNQQPDGISKQTGAKQQNAKRESNNNKENIEVITIDTCDEDTKDNNLVTDLVVANNNNNNDDLIGTRSSLDSSSISKFLKFHHNHHHHQQQQQSHQQVSTKSQSSQTQTQPNILSLLKAKPKHQSPLNKYIAPPGLLEVPGIIDHDRTLLDDIRCEPFYAWDSFNYDKELESQFKSINYFDNGFLDHDITPHKRASLVDWLVQLQNMYELDHEPLYMAVKLVDLYLAKKVVQEENLQLLFMTALLISAKFDERLPPLQISELIQAARLKFGTRYTRKQFISLEVDILKTLDFNIRFPLSYGFLRRFARCTRSDKKTLNLARYILESSLLEYDMIEELESKMAAGSLLLALRMLHIDGPWTETARFYTGYQLEELVPLSERLNVMVLRLSKKNTAIRRKYNHEFFMSVARIPPLLVQCHQMC